MEKPAIWEVVSNERNTTQEGYQIFLQGSYEECVHFLKHKRSGRIQRQNRSSLRLPETDKETIQRLGYLKPLDHAKRLRHKTQV